MKITKRWTLYVSWLLCALPVNVYAACDSSLPLTGARNDILIIVNDNSRDSCEVGRYYAEKRNLGQKNIVHISVPPLYWLNWSEFRNMMDQIIARMQQPELLKPDALAAPICTPAAPHYSPYYCQSSMQHLRENTNIKYIVTTRGVPTLVNMTEPSGALDHSLIFRSSNEHTSIDNHLSYWLVRYFARATVLNFQEREIAFKDGRGMRGVDPAQDGELIVGRIDGLSLGATKRLIDRIIDVEENGIYGKIIGSKFNDSQLNGISYARWFDYSGAKLVYGNSASGENADSWRYQFGLFGEARPECSDYQTNYLATGGPAPQDCLVKIVKTAAPGSSRSNVSFADDVMIYLISQAGQASGDGDSFPVGGFNHLLNWVRNASDTSCVKLCEDHPDPATCRARSTDAFEEINTDCVGVGEGFMGYNLQSFPVTYMTQWPTGWREGAKEGTDGNEDNIAFPEVRTDIGYDDNNSLWFRNTDTIADPKCYVETDFSFPPTGACRDNRRLSFLHTIAVPQQQVDPVNPQRYRISFRFKAENITTGVPLNVTLKVRAYPLGGTTRKIFSYGTQTVQTNIYGVAGGWQEVQTPAMFVLDTEKHGEFDRLDIVISSEPPYTWVDDAIPSGGTPYNTWNWVTSPAPFSGVYAHQSGPATGMHQHYFERAQNKLTLAQGDSLFAYVYLDPANPPSEVMLQWRSSSGWQHRAYWGANLINWGTDGTASRRYMGPLPTAGQWVRLEVPASVVGLENVTIDGMAFTLYDGKATWDYAGKTR